ncbi:MAG: carboxy-S-adenosyl-L-methionine synthase CmoA [Candidatus Riflebacteria bacterium HGW-Riflebacteria-2]|jgi:tRNA (cmo5U34)-methyltransferase|nr:MAG: carboxy-S-adenosyl-L-methionine synthase CmoA [Candidatus Riflebacteria bacterium HGW-Riflebacteria-2]
MNNSNKDRVFAEAIKKPQDFVFDEKVAAVFPDMLLRSIPGYPAIIGMIETLTAQFAQNGSRLYDLGCSLGASAQAMQRGLKADKCRIIAIDNSPAMIGKCCQQPQNAAAPAKIEYLCEDILSSKISDASIVVMNFTLQFVEPGRRCEMLDRIYNGMRPGGILILSEKVRFADPAVNELLIEVYHAFKKANGYSELEISQKRAALEKVLIPESIRDHRDRLIRAGFKSADVWFQCFNFMSMLAIK